MCINRIDCLCMAAWSELEKFTDGVNARPGATKANHGYQISEKMPQIDQSVLNHGTVSAENHKNDQNQMDRPAPDSGLTIQNDDEDDVKAGSENNNTVLKTINSNSPQFQAREIELLVGEVLSERLGEVRYEPAKCKQLSQELAAHIMDRIKALSIKKYKMVAIVSIGSQKGVPGLQFGSRCLWNKDTDHFASVKFTNGSLFAVAMVYGMYFE